MKMKEYLSVMITNNNEKFNLIYIFNLINLYIYHNYYNYL
jgi:hypothetical protein